MSFVDLKESRKTIKKISVVTEWIIKKKENK